MARKENYLSRKDLLLVDEVVERLGRRPGYESSDLWYLVRSGSGLRKPGNGNLSYELGDFIDVFNTMEGLMDYLEVMEDEEIKDLKVMGYEIKSGDIWTLGVKEFKNIFSMEDNFKDHTLKVLVEHQKAKEVNKDFNKDDFIKKVRGDVALRKVVDNHNEAKNFRDERIDDLLARMDGRSIDDGIDRNEKLILRWRKAAQEVEDYDKGDNNDEIIRILRKIEGRLKGKD